MALLASLYAGNVPGVIVMFVDMIRLPIVLVIAVLLWTPGSRRHLRHVQEVRTSAALDAGTKPSRDFASCGWTGGLRFGGGS